MYYEGSLTTAEEASRIPLYEALRSMDECLIEPFLTNATLSSIISMPDDGEQPTVGTARRLVRSSPGEPLILSTASPSLAEKWGKLNKDLANLLRTGDEDIMTQYYRSQPWTAFREEYARHMVSLTCHEGPHQNTDKGS